MQHLAEGIGSIFYSKFIWSTIYRYIEWLCWFRTGEESFWGLALGWGVDLKGTTDSLTERSRRSESRGSYWFYSDRDVIILPHTLRWMSHSFSQSYSSTITLEQGEKITSSDILYALMRSCHEHAWFWKTKRFHNCNVCNIYNLIPPPT